MSHLQLTHQFKTSKAGSFLNVVLESICWFVDGLSDEGFGDVIVYTSVGKTSLARLSRLYCRTFTVYWTRTSTGLDMVTDCMVTTR